MAAFKVFAVLAAALAAPALARLRVADMLRRTVLERSLPAPEERSQESLRRSLLKVRSSGASGDLVYATCNLPECSTLEFAAWDLNSSTKTDLFDFPLGEFEDGFVADNLVVNNTLVISLQYDSKPSQGALVSFDLDTNTLIGVFNASFCFNIFEDPSSPGGDSILCLAVEAACDGGQQCTELRRLVRSTGTDTLLSSFAPNWAPFTVSTLDTRAGLIHTTFGPLSSGHGNLWLALDPATGETVYNFSFPFSTAFIELEYDSETNATYAVVEDAVQGAFMGSVDTKTGAATPLGSNAYFNTTQWNQFNTISCVAPEIGVFFTTAFHYAIPTPPSDPILHLLGMSLADGSIVYDEVVQNPFCEIIWIPRA